MNIAIESLLEGARRAKGAVAVIDVLRAFTTAAVALANGASHIVMVGSVAEALALRDDGAVQLCIGEVRGRTPAAFDFGNSPFALLGANLAGKAIAQRTSAGTQGITAALGAEYLYAASLVTAGATARALRQSGAAQVTLVAMGHEGVARTDEDEVCALHLRNLLQGRPGNPAAVRDMVLASGEAARFRAASGEHAHPRDLELAVDVDRYDFAIRVRMVDGRPTASMQA